MKFRYFLILFCLIGVNCVNTASAEDKIVISYWSNNYMPYPIPGSIDTRGVIQHNTNLALKLNKVTLLAYAFLAVNNDGIAYFTKPSIDLSVTDLNTFCLTHRASCPNVTTTKLLGNFAAFSLLQNDSKNLQKIIAIGGAGSQTSFINTLKHPQNFISSVSDIIKFYHLDGIDLDFEPDALFTAEQASEYTALIQALRHVLGQHYYISVEMPGDNETLHSIGKNNWPLIAANAYISLMGYDFHSYQYPPYLTANDSNLFSDANEPEIAGFYHISDDQAVKYLTFLGVPPNKIILGIPAYFHIYGGVSAVNQGLYQPFDPKKTPTLDVAIGVGSYNFLIPLLSQGFITHTIFMDGKISAQFAFNNRQHQWVSFENNESARAKAQYVKVHQLAGMMVWNIKDDLPADNPLSLLNALQSK